jgi:tetratricopeptide (TPR) repeat protein
MREFAATARKLLDERETTAETVSALLRETPRSQWRELAEREELRSSGALDQLAREAATRMKESPAESLEVAQLALDISARIPSDSYPPLVVAQTRAHAWKDYARALCCLARYDEAFSALDRADRELEPFGSVAHDQAMLLLYRAIALQHVRRFEEAESLLTRAADIFRDHGDDALHAKCVLAYGNLLVRRGNHRGARELLLPLLGSVDPEGEATAITALAWCDIALDNPTTALNRFAEAKQRWTMLGRPIDAMRTQYGAGAALLRLARLDDAIARLTEARRALLGFTLVEEAGLAGLELIEALLMQDRASEAKRLASRIVQEFVAANLNRRAVAALAYLNEIIGSTEATPEIVRSVTSYVVALRDDPTREFSLIN